MNTKFKVVRNPLAGYECCVLCGEFYHLLGEIRVQIYEDNAPCGTVCPECREADQETRRSRILKNVAQELENMKTRIGWANTELRMPSKEEVETFAKRLKKEE